MIYNPMFIFLFFLKSKINTGMVYIYFCTLLTSMFLNMLNKGAIGKGSLVTLNQMSLIKVY